MQGMQETVYKLQTKVQRKDSDIDMLFSRITELESKYIRFKIEFKV